MSESTNIQGLRKFEILHLFLSFSHYCESLTIITLLSIVTFTLSIQPHLCSVSGLVFVIGQLFVISQKISKSCGIIYRIRNTFDIKLKRLIYSSLIHPYLTYCVNVWSSAYRTNLKMLCAVQKRSVRALFAPAQQPHSRDIFLNQKILPLDKLINQQEGIVAYKLINGTYLLGDILTGRHELDHYQLRNY